MKEGLKSKHYVIDEKVKTAVMKWLKEQSTEFYKVGIHALIHIYQPLRSGRIWHKVNF